MRLPDPAKSRAVLIGVGEYGDPDLPDQPAVSNGVKQLRRTLTDATFGILPAENCVTAIDEQDPEEALLKIAKHGADAEDSFIVYYSGHGLVDDQNYSLHLSFGKTRSKPMITGALSYERLRTCVQSQSSAAVKIIIIDCCFSGLAVNSALASDDMLLRGQLLVDGACVITSSSAHEVAIVKAGEQYPAFTKRLIDILVNGVPGGPELLTVNYIYEHMKSGLDGLSNPQKLARNTADLIALGRNPQNGQFLRLGPSGLNAPNVIEICAGGGGLSIGLERAGFRHVALVEVDPYACDTLRENRPAWRVVEDDVRNMDGRSLVGGQGIDLLAAGLPSSPFSTAGLQLGTSDPADIFPEFLRLVAEIMPKAIMVDNVAGLLSEKFSEYRGVILARLNGLGYSHHWWEQVKASDYGVPQKRQSAMLVAMQADAGPYFRWPSPSPEDTLTVGGLLLRSMGSRGWSGAVNWAERAGDLAPTVVGGSKRHGGPDLGPTRAKEAWKRMAVEPKSLGNTVPGDDFPFDASPRLTIGQVALLQGFPEDWKIQIEDHKTDAYRSVANACPPPVATAVALQIAAALEASRRGDPLPLKREDAIFRQSPAAPSGAVPLF